MSIRLAEGSEPEPDRDQIIYTLCGACWGLGLIADIDGAVHTATGIPDNHGRVTRPMKRPPRKTCPRCLGVRYESLPFGLREATEAVDYVRRYRERYGALPGDA